MDFTDEIDYMRGELDFIQGKMDALGPIWGKKFVREHLTQWRDAITISIKYNPKVPELHAFLKAPPYNVRELIKSIEYEDANKEVSVRTLKYVLEFPKFQKAANIQNERQPIPLDVFTAQELKKKTDKIDGNVLQLGPVELDIKAVGRRYKKYIKEFEAVGA